MAESKDWIKALPALRRALECPVCLEVLKAPVSACRNVHVTCSSCRSKLTKCSLCQQPFMQEKPTFVNSLLEVLPRGCRYADDGCKQVLVSRSEHEDFCEFRAISCRARECSERVKLNQMESHYAEKHFERAQIKTMHFNSHWADCWPNRDRKCSVPVFLGGSFFYIDEHYSEEEKCMKIIFEEFPVRKQHANFLVNVKITRGNFVSHNTLKSIIRIGDSSKSGFEIVSEIEENKEDFCVKLSQHMVYKLLDENDRLQFSGNLFTH